VIGENSKSHHHDGLLSHHDDGSHHDQPEQEITPELAMARHVQRLEDEYSSMKIERGIMKFKEVYGGFPGEKDENWVFPSELLDICSVVHCSLQYQVANGGVEAYQRLYSGMACDGCYRIHRVPKTFRSMKKRIMKGYDESSLVVFEYKFPAGLDIAQKTATFVLKKYPALLRDIAYRGPKIDGERQLLLRRWYT